MSIYDDLGPELAHETPGDVPTKPESVAPMANETDEPKKKPRGCGCSSCLGGCAVVSLVGVVLLVVGGLIVWKKLPDWSHAALVAAVEDSVLSAPDK